ncbi:hypothetical protein MGG_07952 [Pyricularia oryzae 70-15]|uniref:Secreted protein n=1 Tax=Pyricularia oryzae (strain 70-15 / ATCC MYA-4617 / FGSC 8958) TaxID=242507 RepID=G4N2T9_PYRO7|nr:uncharacterized protein MGG_07952 [Pyricularia oryzae 70-15]EHA53388.1 hypothetical protein MGG_07952 [Pyricularia oryzae 70-15]
MKSLFIYLLIWGNRSSVSAAGPGEAAEAGATGEGILSGEELAQQELPEGFGRGGFGWSGSGRAACRSVDHLRDAAAGDETFDNQDNDSQGELPTNGGAF